MVSSGWTSHFLPIIHSAEREFFIKFSCGKANMLFSASSSVRNGYLSQRWPADLERLDTRLEASFSSDARSAQVGVVARARSTQVDARSPQVRGRRARDQVKSESRDQRNFLGVPPVQFAFLDSAEPVSTHAWVLFTYFDIGFCFVSFPRTTN